MIIIILSILIVFSVSSYGQTHTSDKTKEIVPEDISVFIDSNFTKYDVLNSLTLSPYRWNF